jgi:hypothetical protein
MERNGGEKSRDTIHLKAFEQPLATAKRVKEIRWEIARGYPLGHC